MKVRYDSKLIPQQGGQPSFAFVFLHADNGEDLALRTLAERWRPHFPDTLFALPVFGISADAVGQGLASLAGLEEDTDFKGAIDAYIAEVRHESGLPNERIALISSGELAPLTAIYGLEADERFGAIIGFGGPAFLVGENQNHVKSRPPMLLVHGQLDPSCDPGAFLQMLSSLEGQQVPVSSCFRPGVGREIENYGADAAMFFLKGALSNSAPLPQVNKSKTRKVADPIKLIIWDLDETLWSGTLDEGSDTLMLNEARAQTIRQLNIHGVVSAICSKNDFELAKRKLEKLGMWDEFVFPRISFEPKGPVIKALIDQMQLRPQNCLFIDDNDINLAEAKSVVPNLQVLDAKTGECDQVLASIVAANSHISKSRVAEYRNLEKRVVEANEFKGDREQFLHSCNIEVAFANSSDLVDFASRIEELVNRSNQLNYLKTRVSPGSIVDFVAEPSLREGFAVFAWDRFGYHGLVGFIGVDVKTERILHMAFSCRIMHMGIENALLARAAQRFDNLQVPSEFGLDTALPPWIKAHAFDHSIRQKVIAEEGNLNRADAKPEIRFMANCQSGIFSHYSGLRDVAEIDSVPRIFAMSMMLNGQFKQQKFPRLVVHYLGTDLYNVYWPPGTSALAEKGLYLHCCEQFCQFLKDQGSELLVVGGQGDAAVDHEHIIRGVTRERISLFNSVWQLLADRNDHVEFLDVTPFVGSERMADCVHFRADASRDIADRIRDWYMSTLSSQPRWQSR